jgi:hypothetical protein
MLDDSNIYQLNLTEKEWEFWHLVSHAGTVMMTAIIAGMTNSEDNVEALARLTQRYAALIREDPDIIVRLLGKIKAADSTARQLKIQEESPVAPLSIVVQLNLGETEAAILFNLLAFSSAILAHNPEAAAACMKILEQQIGSVPDIYNAMLLRITRSVVAALPNADFITPY